MLPTCYQRVTKIRHWCYQNVTKMLPTCYQNPPGVLPTCYQTVTKIRGGCYQTVTKLLPTCVYGEPNIPFPDFFPPDTLPSERYQTQDRKPQSRPQSRPSNSKHPSCITPILDLSTQTCPLRDHRTLKPLPPDRSNRAKRYHLCSLAWGG